MRKSLRKIAALAVCFSFLTGATPAMAETTETQGTTAQTKDVKVQANITSVYSVSLPALIDLAYGVETDGEGNPVEGYWYDLKVGVAGKLTSAESVYVNAVYPCTLTDEGSGETIQLTEFDTGCKTSWSASEVGTCDYDGVNLTNCNYDYCCEGHTIGVRAADVAVKGAYEGNLTFNFGVASN